MKHTHKYIGTTLGSKGYRIYKCKVPGCTHFIAEKLIIGRFCVCWRCGKDFTVHILHKKPHCDSCIKGRKEQSDIDLLKDFAETLNMEI